MDKSVGYKSRHILTGAVIEINAYCIYITQGSNTSFSSITLKVYFIFLLI